MNKRLSVVLVVIVFSTITILAFPEAYAVKANEIVAITIDLQTILLEPNQIIPLLNTNNIANMSSVTISATLPCDSNNAPKLKVLAGVLGNATGIIDSSNDYVNLRGPFDTCLFEDTISISNTTVPALNFVFLKNDGTTPVITNLGSIVTLTGMMGNGTITEESESVIMFSDDFSDNNFSPNWTEVTDPCSKQAETNQRIDWTNDHAVACDKRVRTSSQYQSSTGIYALNFDPSAQGSGNPPILYAYLVCGSGFTSNPPSNFMRIWWQGGSPYDGIDVIQSGSSVHSSSVSTLSATGSIKMVYNDNTNEIKFYQWSGTSWTQKGNTQDYELNSGGQGCGIWFEDYDTTTYSGGNPHFVDNVFLTNFDFPDENPN